MTVSRAVRAARQWAADHGHPQPDDRMLQAYEQARGGPFLITEPAALGPAFAQIRGLLGIGRRPLARAIAEKTGRSVSTINVQLWNWDSGHHRPDLASVALVLAELGLQLAVILPDEQNGDRL